METAHVLIAGIVLWLLLGGLCLGYWIARVVERQHEKRERFGGWIGPQRYGS